MKPRGAGTPLPFHLDGPCFVLVPPGSVLHPCWPVVESGPFVVVAVHAIVVVDVEGCSKDLVDGGMLL